MYFFSSSIALRLSWKELESEKSLINSPHPSFPEKISLLFCSQQLFDRFELRRRTLEKCKRYNGLWKQRKFKASARKDNNSVSDVKKKNSVLLILKVQYGFCCPETDGMIDVGKLHLSYRQW